MEPLCAVIHLDHLRHNVRVLQQQAGDATLMGVVKADAYGHGAVRIVEVLREEGIHHFAVSRIGEALALREAGCSDPILVLGAPLPHHLDIYAAHDLAVTVSSTEVARAVTAAATPAAPLRVHVKVDTGMGRIGVPPDVAPAVMDRLQQAPNVEVAGLWTHLATAEEEDSPFAQTQLDQFDRIRAAMDAAPACVHVANSSALFTLPDRVARLRPALVRLGIMLYGLAGRADLAARAGLRPVMEFTAQVTHIKTVAPGTSISYGRLWRAERRTRIATLAVGYGDGYPRHCSNRAEVRLNNHRVPVVGAVCMDMLMVDLGPPGTAPSAAVGDTAVLFGPGGPSASDVAAWAGTIPYEVCCRISTRVPRRYVSTSA